MGIEYEVAFLPGIRNGKNGDRPVVYHLKYTHLTSSLCGKYPSNHDFKAASDKSESDVSCAKCAKTLECRKKHLNIQRKSV